MPVQPVDPNIILGGGPWARVFVGEIERIAADKYQDENSDPVYGPLSFIANTMKSTAYGFSPISAARPDTGFTFTLAPRGEREFATKEDLAKHGHPAYEDVLRRLAEGLARGTAQASARDGGSYRGIAEALMARYQQGDDLSGFILGYSTGRQFDLNNAPIDIMGPMVRPSLRRGWEYAKDPGLGADFTRAVHTYLLENQTLRGRR